MEAPESKARGSREQEGPAGEAFPRDLGPLGRNTEGHLRRVTMIGMGLWRSGDTRAGNPHLRFPRAAVRKVQA